MKQSSYKSYEDLPLFLNVNDLSKAIGIAPSSCYELMHEKDFPSIRIGKRLVVPREKLSNGLMSSQKEAANELFVT